MTIWRWEVVNLVVIDAKKPPEGGLLAGQRRIT
jgi:hypothetical protein